MKRRIMSLPVMLFLLAPLFLSGCATPYPSGIVYTDVKFPLMATSNASSEKVGTSECKSYFFLFATGDASIEAAMKNGGITKIHHIDWDAYNVLGIYGRYKVTVYGE